MLVTLLVIVMFVSPSQPSKTPSFISVMVFGISILNHDLHSLKA